MPWRNRALWSILRTARSRYGGAGSRDWHRSLTPPQIEEAARRARLDTVESDLDWAFDYLDELSFRQETLEHRLGVESVWEPVAAKLEQAVVQGYADGVQGSGFRLQMFTGCVLDDCSVYEAEGYDQIIVTNHHVISELTHLPYRQRVVQLVGANPIRRSTVVLQKTFAMVLAALVVGIATFAGVDGGSLVGGLGMSIGNIAATSLLVTLLG